MMMKMIGVAVCMAVATGTTNADEGAFINGVECQNGYSLSSRSECIAGEPHNDQEGQVCEGDEYAHPFYCGTLSLEDYIDNKLSCARCNLTGSNTFAPETGGDSFDDDDTNATMVCMQTNCAFSFATCMNNVACSTHIVDTESPAEEEPSMEAAAQINAETVAVVGCYWSKCHLTFTTTTFAPETVDVGDYDDDDLVCMETKCASPLATCVNSFACAMFFGDALRTGEEPTMEDAESIGTEAVALLECYRSECTERTTTTTSTLEPESTSTTTTTSTFAPESVGSSDDDDDAAMVCMQTNCAAPLATCMGDPACNTFVSTDSEAEEEPTMEDAAQIGAEAVALFGCYQCECAEQSPQRQLEEMCPSEYAACMAVPDLGCTDFMQLMDAENAGGSSEMPDFGPVCKSVANKQVGALFSCTMKSMMTMDDNMDATDSWMAPEEMAIFNTMNATSLCGYFEEMTAIEACLSTCEEETEDEDAACRMSCMGPLMSTMCDIAKHGLAEVKSGVAACTTACNTKTAQCATSNDVNKASACHAAGTKCYGDCSNGVQTAIDAAEEAANMACQIRRSQRGVAACATACGTESAQCAKNAAGDVSKTRACVTAGTKCTTDCSNGGSSSQGTSSSEGTSATEIAASLSRVAEYSAGCKEVTLTAVQAKNPPSKDTTTPPSKDTTTPSSEDTTCRRARRFTPFPRARRDGAACATACGTESLQCATNAAGDVSKTRACVTAGTKCTTDCSNVAIPKVAVTAIPATVSQGTSSTQGGNMCELLAAILKTIDCQDDTACAVAVADAEATVKDADAAGVGSSNDGFFPESSAAQLVSGLAGLSGIALLL